MAVTHDMAQLNSEMHQSRQDCFIFMGANRTTRINLTTELFDFKSHKGQDAFSDRPCLTSPTLITTKPINVSLNDGRPPAIHEHLDTGRRVKESDNKAPHQVFQKNIPAEVVTEKQHKRQGRTRAVFKRGD